MSEVPRAKSPSNTLGTSALLAAAGSFLDGFTYVGHGHVFATAMTGNMVLLGINCFTGLWPSAYRHLWPILAFLLGIAAAKAVGLHAIGSHLRNPYMAVLLLEISLLSFLSMMPAGVGGMSMVTSLAFAASLQTETFRKVHGHNYSSTFMAGNLRSLSEGAFDRFFGTHSPEAAQILRDFSIICTAFLVGAAAGAYATHRFGSRALWFDVALLTVVAVRVLRKPL